MPRDAGLDVLFQMELKLFFQFPFNALAPH
jgi:hypothetical protein